MSPSRPLLAFALAVLTNGCTWTYLEYPRGVGWNGPARFNVSAGKDFGPEADRAKFIHPQLIELAFEQPESNLPNYYMVVLKRALGGDPLAAGDIEGIMGNFKLVAKQDEVVAWNKLNEQGWNPDDGKIAARGLSRAVGRYVAPAVIVSIAAHGYGRIYWGHKTEEDLSSLKMTGNSIYITVNEATQELKIHTTAPHSNLNAQWQVVTWSLAAADPEWIWEPHDKAGNPIALPVPDESMPRVCAEVRPLREEDFAAVSRMN